MRLDELVHASILSSDHEACLQVVTDYEAEMQDLRDTMEEFFVSEVPPTIPPMLINCSYL